jgi:uncharacterized membrane protein YdfJ with MMPL/SSD domain
MTTASPLARIARASGNRPWLALLAWVLLLGVSVATAVFGVTGEGIFDRLATTTPVTSDESGRADALISGSEDGADPVTLLVHGVDLDNAAVVAAGEKLSDTFSSDEFVDPLSVPTMPDGSRVDELQPLFSSDDKGVLFVVYADRDRAEAALTALRDDLRDELPEATVEIGSGDLLVDSIVSISQSDLARGEAIALPVALVIMLVVFGGFLAAGVPLIGAIAAIIGALGALFCFTYLMDVDTTVVNVITAIGLGLSIDYGLLIVSRFREEYRAIEPASTSKADRRAHRLDAISRSADTAGRTVFYSGLIFAIASLGLLLFEPRIVRAIGIGALSVTVIAIASALTLVPALLGLAGERIVRPGLLARIPLIGRVFGKFGDIAPTEGVFSRLTRLVQRRPAVITILCAAALMVLAVPALSLQLANTSADGVPSSSTQATFVDTVDEQFPEASGSRIVLVSSSETDAESWATEVEELPKVISVATPTESGDGWVSAVRVDARDGVGVVQQIRADRPSASSLVTGTDARTVDFSASLIERAPLVILVVALATIVLMFLMTGSLVVPLKALLASTISLGASLGILVWGFQWGNFASVMHFDTADVLGVDVLVIVLVLAFGFGLAMDYEMFILSRVKEAVDSGVEPREAIARGLQRSGRIITSAGLIIVIVFTGFASGDLMVIKQLGVALAVAVILDATLVRMLLVPAVMTWQHKIMWWAPRWMKRIHARFGLRES